MKHIVQLSGGKDSTAMLLMMLEKGMTVDEIIFCDTGMEFPQMYEHLDKVERYTGREITRLKADKTFMYYFAKHKRSRTNRKVSDGYGWPRMWVRWCTRVLKQEPVKKYLSNTGQHLLYIGIAADEPKRHKNIPANTRHPLYDWGVTEQQALQYCYERGFDWGGLYKQFRRVSCWCCPMQRIGELRTLYHNFPELWQQLRQMDELTEFKFRPDYSVAELELRFVAEDAQMTLLGGSDGR